MRDSFLFYDSWRKAIQDLPGEIRLQIYEATFEYAFSGNVPKMDEFTSLAFNFIRKDIDIATANYERKKSQCSAAGRSHTGNQYTRRQDSENGTVVPIMEGNGTEWEKGNIKKQNITKREESVSLLGKDEKEIEDFVFKEFFWLNRKNPEYEMHRFIDNYKSQSWKKANGQLITDLSAAVRLWKCEESGVRFGKEYLEVLRGFCLDTNQYDNAQFLSQINDFSSCGNDQIMYCSKEFTSFVEQHGEAFRRHYNMYLKGVLFYNQVSFSSIK